MMLLALFISTRVRFKHLTVCYIIQMPACAECTQVVIRECGTILGYRGLNAIQCLRLISDSNARSQRIFLFIFLLIHQQHAFKIYKNS